MPLPSALLERLKKRGIVQEPPPEEEEVIAEDHDSDSEKSSDVEGDESNNEEEDQQSPQAIKCVVGCPNKVNIYHDCTDYCQKKYGNGKEVPSPRTERKYRKLIKRFPLPQDWLDVWEPGTARYYFWNTANDEVSWLPPLHPKAKVTQSAAKLKLLMKPNRESDHSSDDSNQSSESDSESDDSVEEEAVKISIRNRDVKSNNPPFRGRQVVKRNDLDPMDPASYSDNCPRGRWSDGLVTVRGEEDDSISKKRKK